MNIEKHLFFNDYIFNNNHQYCIPVFQRDYAWTAEQCTKLFSDIIAAYERRRQHFFGSFVHAYVETKNNINYHIIIDGQQRYTTLYILLKAMADSADTSHDKEVLESFLFNKDPFDRYTVDEKSKLKLKPVKSDDEQLRLLMADDIDLMEKGKTGYIYHNYMLFKELISEFLGRDERNTVMMIYDGIQKLICAGIELDRNDDAQEVFESINSTGIKLGVPDLIRNYVLMTEADQERLYADYWLPAQALITKERMEPFFQDYINLKLERFTSSKTAYADFKEVFREGGFTNESMLSEILHYAKQYHMFYQGDDSLGPETNRALEGLRRLGQSTVYLFLFQVFDDYETGIINQQELGKVMNLLLAYSIRRLVCEINSNSLRGLYKTLYNRVFDRQENYEHYYDSIVSFLQQLTSKDVIPGTAEFKTALKERNLYRKNALCKYLLSSIENQGKERVIVDNLTIEHVMPQNKNLSTAWQKMLGEEWEQVRDRYLHTLGNLTLTGYNSELGDMPFAKKQEQLAETITHVTVLYEDIKDKDVWNEETIKARANRLAPIIVKLFPIEQPKTKIDFSDPRYELYTAVNPEYASNRTPNYYEILGERINVGSFAEMVRSVAEKLYELDPQPIDEMASSLDTFPEWTIPVFSYDRGALRRPRKMRGEGDIYINVGPYSARDCIDFIRALLRKYNLSLEEDFIYSSRPN